MCARGRGNLALNANNFSPLSTVIDSSDRNVLAALLLHPLRTRLSALAILFASSSDGTYVCAPVRTFSRYVPVSSAEIVRDAQPRVECLPNRLIIRPAVRLIGFFFFYTNVCHLFARAEVESSSDRGDRAKLGQWR